MHRHKKKSRKCFSLRFYMIVKMNFFFDKSGFKNIKNKKSLLNPSVAYSTFKSKQLIEIFSNVCLTSYPIKMPLFRDDISIVEVEEEEEDVGEEV